MKLVLREKNVRTLWHATTLETAGYIIGDDKLVGRTPDEEDDISGTHVDPPSPRYTNYVSTSRFPHGGYAQSLMGPGTTTALFELDPQRMRGVTVQAVDWHHISAVAQAYTGDIVKSFRGDHHSGMGWEAEERVWLRTRELPGLSTYVRRVLVWYRTEEDLREFVGEARRGQYDLGSIVCFSAKNNSVHDMLYARVEHGTLLRDLLDLPITESRGRPRSALRESPTVIRVWHGGNLDHQTQGKPRGTARSRAEYGPGLYTTTHYQTASTYAKGGRRLYQLVIRQGVDAHDVRVSAQDLQELSPGMSRAGLSKLVQYVQNRYPQGLACDTLLNILGEDYRVDPDVLRQFLVQHGVDYREVPNAFGWHELMLVVFNPRVILRSQVVRATSETARDLPTEFAVDAQDLTEAVVTDVMSVVAREVESATAGVSTREFPRRIPQWTPRIARAVHSVFPGWPYDVLESVVENVLTAVWRAGDL